MMLYDGWTSQWATEIEGFVYDNCKCEVSKHFINQYKLKLPPFMTTHMGLGEIPWLNLVDPC